MTIPEPLNTILLVNTLIGLCVSSIAGIFAVTWMFDRLTTWLFRCFKVWDVLLHYAMYHREFKQWRKSK